MEKLYAQIGDADGNKDTVFDITPDLANAFTDAIRNVVGVEPPRQAQTFDDLTATIAQTSRVIQHLEAFRELAIIAADRTSPHADRKAIAISAAMPPSRLYRVLEKHGQPTDRKKAVGDSTGGTGDTVIISKALEAAVRALGGLWDTHRAVTALRDGGYGTGDQEQQEKRAREALRDLAKGGVLVKVQDRPVQYRRTEN